jgi:hypothetical protein
MVGHNCPRDHGSIEPKATSGVSRQVVQHYAEMEDVGAYMKIANNKLNGLSRCPQCGVAAPHITRSSGHWSNGRWWLLAACQSCENMMMLRSKPTTSNTYEGAEIDEVLPRNEEVEDALPERARRYMSQALDSFSAPDGAAMLLGSAVDAMLKAKELVDGSVYERIGQAVSAGLLTQEMADWAHEVRLGSNQPRHADLDTPHMSLEDAKALSEFTIMLGHILFTLPARVAKRRATHSA